MTTVANNLRNILLIFLASTCTFSAFADRRVVNCPSFSESKSSDFADLIRELIRRDLNGYRISSCRAPGTFYNYLSNKVTKDGDFEGRFTKANPKVKVIPRKGSDIQLNRISKDEDGIFTVTFSVKYKIAKKMKRSHDILKFMLLDGDLPIYESCADIVSDPEKLLVYDSCIEK